MQSNYKALGNYIQIVDERNKALEDLPLMGLSVSKVFFPTIANLVGTDMSTYKIVYRNQFTYIADTSRRGDKIAIALNDGFDKMLVSQAYTPFEIADTTKLHPEYLMMWFRRPEFDRYARFMSHGSAREIFGWDEMCNTLLPIPSIEKQREIVAEYNTVKNRIELNNQLIQKLEETAQAIYKQWFVDFEFPDENGNPYKSSGGKMVYNEELDKEIPEGWEVKNIGDLTEHNYANLNPNDKYDYIQYLDTSNIIDNEIDVIQILNLKTDTIPSRAKRKVSHNDVVFSTVRPNLRHFGVIYKPDVNLIVSTGFTVLKPIYPNICGELIYLHLTSNEILESLHARAEMSVSTYPSITSDDLLEIKIAIPPKTELSKISTNLNSINIWSESLKKEKKILQELSVLLHSKLATIKN